MIALNIPQIIREQVSSELQIEPSGENRYAIYMPFIFDDGDSCGFYLEKSNNEWRLVDQGEIVRRAAYTGVDLLSEGHAERFNRIAEFYGLAVRDGKLSLEIKDDAFSSAIFTFTQVCLEALNLTKMPKERHVQSRKGFAGKLAHVLEPIVPADRIVHTWYDPKHDPERIYPVDYHIRGKDEPWFVFGVPGGASCMLATIICQHFKMKKVRFKSLVIYDHEEEIRTLYTKQLNEVVDQAFPRVSEAKNIRRFIKGII